MIKWFYKLLCSKIVTPVTERASNETSDNERKIRNLRRRIEEQKQAIGYYNTTQRGISSEFTKVEEPIQDVGRLQKNAELNALKAKLKPKNI